MIDSEPSLLRLIQGYMVDRHVAEYFLRKIGTPS